MVAVNPPGVTGYGPTAGPSNVDGVTFVDTVDGTPGLSPAFGANPPPTFAQAVIIPTAIGDTAGMPSQNAIVIELRVITNLLLLQLGASAPDPSQMRADEAFNINLATGVL